MADDTRRECGEPGPRRLSRVTHLRVHHVGARIQLSFAGVPGAHRYGVAMTLSSGQHVVLLTTRHTLTIARVFGEFTGQGYGRRSRRRCHDAHRAGRNCIDSPGVRP